MLIERALTLNVRGADSRRPLRRSAARVTEELRSAAACLDRVGSAVGLAVVVISLLFVLVRPAGAADSGWFTQAQATRGHQLFNNQCAQCHRPDLTGAAGPALVGPAFLAKWGNKPVSDLYSFEHQYMPAVNPGSVPPDQLWTITAYILQKNGFPSGNSDLSEAASTRTLTK
jgi:S-disulfanyl-L-cysteine oxidoreductase SoxD